MEELTVYLRSFGIDCLIQEAWENERAILKESSWSNSREFGSHYLDSSDPPNWSTSDKMRQISSIRNIEYPTGFEIALDWTPEKAGDTDQDGWKYAVDFSGSEWSEKPLDDTEVRHRRWQRLVVESEKITLANEKISQFPSILSLFRSISPNIIHHIFQNQIYQIQMILECQRSLENGVYSSEYLLPTDPPRWSSGAGDDSNENPKFLPKEKLVEVIGTIYNGGNSWDILHDFIYEISTETDALGWQYNTCFQSETPWTKANSNGETVRRRLWLRTCVPDHLIFSCQQNFRSYFLNHPRGVVKTGYLQRQGSLKLMWYEAFATLTDHYLEVILLKYDPPFLSNSSRPDCDPSSESPGDEWYLGKHIGLKPPVTSKQSLAPAPRQIAFLGGGVVKYPLQGCEVIELGSTSDSGELTDNSPAKRYQFGLRTGKSWIQSKSPSVDEPYDTCRYSHNCRILCVFNAYNQSDYDEWIHTLRNHLALINLYFWPIPSGPPTLDKIVIEGSMWKRGKILPFWNYRQFELRQDGVLVYYKGSIVMGKIRLKSCYIEDPLEESDVCPSPRSSEQDCNSVPVCSPYLRNSTSPESHPNLFEFRIRNMVDGEIVMLKTSSIETKMQWIIALRNHSNYQCLIQNEGDKHYSTASGMIRKVPQINPSLTPDIWQAIEDDELEEENELLEKRHSTFHAL